MTASPVQARARAGSRAPGRAEALLGDSPWERGDVVVLGGRLVVGVAGILAGWIGCSGTLDWNQQQAWVAVGIGGLVIAVAGVGAWLLAGVRAIKLEQVDVLGLVEEHLGIAPAAEPVTVATAGSGALVTGAGMTMFHQPDCVLVRGKATHAVTRREAMKLTPCSVCRP